MDEQHARRAETDRAFEGLYRRHRVDVYRAAMRKTHDHHEAEDVTQTAFLDAYRAVLKGTRPELPRPWLLAIAENIRRRRFAASIRRPRPVPLDEDTTAAPASTRIEAESVLAALETLAPNQRSAFLLREVAGLSYAEIAAQLEVSLPAVQMLLFRARQSLRILLAAPDEKSSRLYSPAWLSWVSTRWDVGSAGASAFGAAGAAAVVVAGVGAAAPSPAQRPASVAPTRPALVVKHDVQTADAAPLVAVRAVAKQRAPQRAKPTRAAARTTGTPPKLVRAQATPSAAPAPSVDLGAGPVAPSASPAAAAAGSDGPSAPALVPTSTTLDAVVQPVSVPEVVTVPVLVPPPVEGAEVPALEVPTVPDVPVAVGITPPVLPGP